MLHDPTLLDLECTAIDGIEAYYDDDIESVEAPSNYKDPVKIAEYIEREKTRRREQFVKQAALDPDLCRIVYLGVWKGFGTPCLWPCEDELDEAHALHDFWQGYQAGEVLCGFNIRSYDIPVILRRSLYLGVPVKPIERDRYRSTHVIDLFEQLNEGRKHQMHSLDWYHRRMGFTPYADDITGADVPACVARGDWGKVRDHLMLDLLRVRDVARRMGIMSQETVHA